MARGHKLTDSISISELMHMREVEGLSNGEIARKLGCSINTIHAHIGSHPEGKRAKRKHKQLPSLPEKQIPDMPRESFKERCERLMARADERKADAEADKAREAHCKALDMAAQLSNGIVPVIVHGTVYDVPRVAYEVIKEEALKINAKESEPLLVSTEDAIATPEQVAPLRRLEDLAREAYMKREKEQKERAAEIIPELLEVFGPQMVRHFLKVDLYLHGIPYCYELKREVMLEALKKLNSKEAICND